MGCRSYVFNASGMDTGPLRAVHTERETPLWNEKFYRKSYQMRFLPYKSETEVFGTMESPSDGVT